MKRTRLQVAPLAGALAIVAFASTAHADTIMLEAEPSVSSSNFHITSPLDIRDWNLASGDRYLEGQSGFNSISSPPSVGRACQEFEVTTAGTYRVWGRVIAPTDGDDSFWFNVNDGAFVRWNQIALGSTWHWDHVHDNATPTAPSTFTLAAGTNKLCVAYREDGTKLDLLILTDDPNFSPTAALTGPPAPPKDITAVSGDGRNVVSWSHSLGATSYTIEKKHTFDPGEPWTTLVSGVSGHSYFHNTTAGSLTLYRVTAVASTGTSAPSEFFAEGMATLSPHSYISTPVSWPHTAPLLYISEGDGLGAPEGNDSKDAPPATGWARYDFRIAKTVAMGVWQIVVTPDSGSDSFWVRMDNGPWIKWNEMTPDGDPTGCGWDQVHDSDNNDTPVTFTLGPGTHKLEFAYREDGTLLRRSYIHPTSPGGCFD